MRKLRDPELIALIRAFHLAEAEEDRLDDLVHQAEDRHREAEEYRQQMEAELAAALARHARRDENGRLIDFRTFYLSGRCYRPETLPPLRDGGADRLAVRCYPLDKLVEG